MKIRRSTILLDSVLWTLILVYCYRFVNHRGIHKFTNIFFLKIIGREIERKFVSHCSSFGGWTKDCARVFVGVASSSQGCRGWVTAKRNGDNPRRGLEAWLNF